MIIQTRMLANNGPQKRSYPCLLVSTLEDLTVVVIFDSECCGTVVHTEDDDYEVGQFYKDWDMSDFNPYYGKIEISAQ